MTARDFSRRASTPELMDADDCNFESFRGCLADLALVNRLTRAYRPTIAFLDRLAASGLLPSGRPVAIVDVGSGYGDMLRLVRRWAAGRGLAVSLTGVDLNPWSARAASEAAPDDAVQWTTANIFNFQPTAGVDIVLSSLFAHHLDDAAVIGFLRWMENQARIGWFVNDLHRHPLPYHVFATLARALRFHPFVQHDGPVSITRAFVADDWRCLLAAAAVPEGAAGIAWWMPFRICVSRVKSR